MARQTKSGSERGDKDGRAFCFMALFTLLLGQFTSVSLGLVLLCGAIHGPLCSPFGSLCLRVRSCCPTDPTLVEGGEGGNGVGAG